MLSERIIFSEKGQFGNAHTFHKWPGRVWHLTFLPVQMTPCLAPILAQLIFQSHSKFQLKCDFFQKVCSCFIRALENAHY